MYTDDENHGFKKHVGRGGSSSGLSHQDPKRRKLNNIANARKRRRTRMRERKRNEKRRHRLQQVKYIHKL